MSPDKVKIKEKVLSSYQLKTVDNYNSPVDNVKKLVSDFFDKENYALYYENLQLYLMLGLKLKQAYRVWEMAKSKWLKLSNLTQKKNRNRKNWWKEWKSIVQINEQHCV